MRQERISAPSFTTQVYQIGRSLMQHVEHRMTTPSRHSGAATLARLEYSCVSDTHTVSGTVQRGIGAASQNLIAQLPAIAAEFPEVAGCHRGTINLLLDSPLLVLAPDHRTSPILWHPDFAPGEVFDLLRIELEVRLGTAPVPSWLYIPHASPHRRDLRLQEVLAPKLNLSTGARCRIHISRKVRCLPYTSQPVLVVM